MGALLSKHLQHLPRKHYARKYCVAKVFICAFLAVIVLSAVNDGWNNNPAAGPANRLPPALAHILLCVTFHWNVEKLLYLEAILSLASSYRTVVDILVITDDANNLREVIASWGYAETVSVWSAAKHDGDLHKYSLLWAHKAAIQDHVPGSTYTSVVYLEDDTRLSWASLVSWAVDSEVLEPLEWTRCMFRTEVSPATGQLNMLDWTFPYNITTFQIFDVQKSNPARYVEVAARLQGMDCGALRDGSAWPCRVHKHFVSPNEPFQGMWMATRKQLEKYMAHPYWNKTEALHAPLHLSRGFGYPERSNSMNILIDVREGYESTCMVPVTFSSIGYATLSGVANIEHLRNGYSTDGNLTKHGKLPVAHALEF